MALSASPFATFLIVGPTCFFLGILFASFPYDYNVLWTTPLSSNSTAALPSLISSVTNTIQNISSTTLDPREPYYQILEFHLRFIHASPPLISRILHIVIATGITGFTLKLAIRPNESNMLFDGASLVLYICGVIVYITNIVHGLRVVTGGTYKTAGDVLPLGTATEKVIGGDVLEERVGREDTLKVIAASHTILALVMFGVLVLQAGQWYAAKKEAAEIEEMDRLDKEERKHDERRVSRSFSTTNSHHHNGGGGNKEAKKKV